MDWINGLIAFALPPVAVPLAALPDAWVIGFGIAQLTTTVLLGLGLYRLNVGQRKLERMEDSRDRQLETHKQDMFQANQQILAGNARLVDAKIEQFDHIVNNYKQFFTSTGDLLNRQIERHTAKMEQLTTTDHENEVKSLKALNELMLKIATKDDLRQMREDLCRER